MILKKIPSRLILCLLSVLVIGSCKVPFDPPLKPSNTNSLVVEGYIDGAAPSVFKISRSRKLTVGDTAVHQFEFNANVSIEDDNQGTYRLVQQGNGIYSSVNTLPLTGGRQYHLHIITAGGIEYLSDLVLFKQAPAIDTIAWELKDNGVQVFLNTRDLNNATRYYRWEYNETWEIHSTYFSSYKAYIPDPTHISIIPRTEDVFRCWQTHNSTNILLGSSARLTDDVINRMPLTYIEPHDKRLSVLYSIWVKQYAMDVDGYNYYTAIRNNTERVGSIFDPQPNETAGNIHCITNPAEQVIGYVNAGSSSQKRIFISNSSLGVPWNLVADCPLKEVPNISDSLFFYFQGGWEPIDRQVNPQNQIVYSASYKSCVDCTISGTNIKPSFWP